MSGRELYEAPLVEDTDARIKPSRIGKPPAQGALTQTVPVADTGNPIARTDSLPKPLKRKRVLTQEHKAAMRRGREKAKKAKLAEHTTVPNTGTALGDEVIGVREEEKQPVMVQVEGDITTPLELEEIPIGTQLPVGETSTHPFFEANMTDVVDLFNYSIVEPPQQVENIEQSSANKFTAHFTPTQTIFNQNGLQIRRDLGELEENPSSFEMPGNSSVPKIAQFEGLMARRGQRDYMLQTGNDAPTQNPGYNMASYRNNPAGTPASYVRSAGSGFEVFNRSRGDAWN